MLPSLENLTMRSLVSPPWPSATKISPFGATYTSVGASKASVGGVAGDAGLAERHQQLAVLAELHDGVALAVVQPPSSVDPDIAVRGRHGSRADR